MTPQLPQFQFHCPECKTKNPPIAQMSSPNVLQIPMGEKLVPHCTLRILLACGQCGCLFSVQYIPMDMEIVGTQAPEPSRLVPPA